MKYSTAAYIQTPGGSNNLVDGGTFYYGPFDFNVKVESLRITMLADDFDNYDGFGKSSSPLSTPITAAFKDSIGGAIPSIYDQIPVYSTFDFITLCDTNMIFSERVSKDDILALTLRNGEYGRYIPAGYSMEMVLPDMTSYLKAISYRFFGKEV